MTYYYTMQEGGHFTKVYCKRQSKKNVVEKIRRLSNQFSICFKGCRYDEPLRMKGLNPWTSKRTLKHRLIFLRLRDLCSYFD